MSVRIMVLACSCLTGCVALLSGCGAKLPVREYWSASSSSPYADSVVLHVELNDTVFVYGRCVSHIDSATGIEVTDGDHSDSARTDAELGHVPTLRMSLTNKSSQSLLVDFDTTRDLSQLPAFLKGSTPYQQVFLEAVGDARVRHERRTALVGCMVSRKATYRILEPGRQMDLFVGVDLLDECLVTDITPGIYEVYGIFVSGIVTDTTLSILHGFVR